MKTTIELPDGLFRLAKSAAASDGITLKELVTEALKQRLGQRAEAGPARWRALAGQLRDLRDESRRIDRAIEAEFGIVDEEEQ